MNKQQYQKSRKLIRENGLYALRWMNHESRNIMKRLSSQQNDKLQERNELVQYCNTNNINYTFINII